MLLACSTPPAPSPQTDQGQVPRPAPRPLPPDDEPPIAAAPIVQIKSRWQPVRWADLPGFEADGLHEAWNAWIRSCERPAALWAALCPEIRRLSIADDAAKRQWMRAKLQPYRVEPLAGASEGLLTSYYEPVLEARRASRSCAAQTLVFAQRD
jgi:membrane-bound lytic murein transglycosylase A